MPAGCMTWEGTSGNGAKTGMTRRSPAACCAVRRGTIATATLCLLPVATASSLIIVSISSGFVVLWRLSLRVEAGLFPFALLCFYLLRQPRSGRFFMRETPPLYTVAGQLVGWTLDRTADFPKSQRFTFGQRVDNLSLDCLQ